MLKYPPMWRKWCDRGDEINTKVRDDQYSFIKPSKISLKYKTIV